MGYRIVIVDDSLMIRSLLKDFLEILGHQVVGEAEDGAAGLQAYQTHKPDLVTLDLSLPDTDGFALLQEIRRIDPAASAILITANTQDKIYRQAQALNVLALIQKPFEIKHVAAALAKMPPTAGGAAA